MGVRGFSLAKASCNSPYLCLVVFVPLDELCGEGETFANGNLKRGDAVVIADEVSGDAGLVEVEILILAGLHGSLQAVFGMINVSAHSCAVSFPGEFAEFDGGDKTSDDFLETFGGDFVVGGQGGEDSVRRHGGVVVENDGRGMAVDDNFDRVGTRGRDGIVDAVVRHVWTKVLDEVVEVVGEPGIWSEDEG